MIKGKVEKVEKEGKRRGETKRGNEEGKRRRKGNDKGTTGISV